MNRSVLVAAACVMAIALFPSRDAAVAQAPGVLAPKPPSQLDHAAPPVRRDRFVLTPVAQFTGSARVLGRKDYRFGAEAALSPTDLALGWGRMSDSRVVDALEITQSNRWYHYRYRVPPIPPPEIARTSANMHFIPATDAVAAALERVREGDVVEFRGSLVDVRRADGWTWRTSRRRDDIGSGACEIVYLEHLRIR